VESKVNSTITSARFADQDPTSDPRLLTSVVLIVAYFEFSARLLISFISFSSFTLVGLTRDPNSFSHHPYFSGCSVFRATM